MGLPTLSPAWGRWSLEDRVLLSVDVVAEAEAASAGWGQASAPAPPAEVPPTSWRGLPPYPDDPLSSCVVPVPSAPSDVRWSWWR
ncbi:hypothetical protein E2C01_045517 [Portunus trituberculatus]|uniref:Uncharacterized protein n=1 Tax=Portunus trituberculatus TaxID=210409 RepID=A0A5B7G2H4_PORTR|nr:hypothetical protein [Portunus trituberculatus]